jgi:hypothetical protein
VAWLIQLAAITGLCIPRTGRQSVEAETAVAD